MKWLKKLTGRTQEDAPLSAPPPPPFGQTPWHPTHRHKKGGGYRLLGYATLEADRSRVAVYDDAEGNVWVRDAAEFEQLERFKPVSLIDPAAPASSKDAPQ